MERSKDKLLIVGPSIRCGLGGVTVHVARLISYLENNGIPFYFIDYKYRGVLEQLRIIAKYEIVHFHISNPVYQFFLVSYSRLFGTKVVMTLHGNYGRFGSFKNYLVRCSVKLSTIPIAINQASYDSCRKINSNTRFVPAFIPPQKEESLPYELEILLNKQKEKGIKIVSTNASTFSEDKYGQEIYGIGFLIEYFKDRHDFMLVVSDPSGKNSRRYKDAQSNSILFIDYPHSFFEILKKSDYFVRNTSTDGDALSVKEALYLRVPAICTDVVDRPIGVRLFRYCDKVSFEKSLCDKQEIDCAVINGAPEIVNIYNDLSEE